MTKQTKAQRLADELDSFMENKTLYGASAIDKATAELRRLDALVDELVEALTQIGLMTKEDRIERLVIAALDKTEEQA